MMPSPKPHTQTIHLSWAETPLELHLTPLHAITGRAGSGRTSVMTSVEPIGKSSSLLISPRAHKRHLRYGHSTEIFEKLPLIQRHFPWVRGIDKDGLSVLVMHEGGLVERDIDLFPSLSMLVLGIIMPALVERERISLFMFDDLDVPESMAYDFVWLLRAASFRAQVVFTTNNKWLLDQLWPKEITVLEPSPTGPKVKESKTTSEVAENILREESVGYFSVKSLAVIRGMAGRGWIPSPLSFGGLSPIKLPDPIHGCVWEKPDGTEVVVTEVLKPTHKPPFDDAICVGPVVKFKRQATPQDLEALKPKAQASSS